MVKPTLELLREREREVQQLLLELTNTRAERDAIRAERDIYAEGLHKLRDEMFQAKMHLFVQLTPQRGQKGTS